MSCKLSSLLQISPPYKAIPLFVPIILLSIFIVHCRAGANLSTLLRSTPKQPFLPVSTVFALPLSSHLYEHSRTRNHLAGLSDRPNRLSKTPRQYSRTHFALLRGLSNHYKTHAGAGLHLPTFHDTTNFTLQHATAIKSRRGFSADREPCLYHTRTYLDRGVSGHRTKRLLHR